MLNQAMVSMVQNIVHGGGVGQSGHGALVMDLSFKLNASGFGLAGMAVPAKHLENGFWRTESVLLGCCLSVIPVFFRSVSLVMLCAHHVLCSPPRCAQCVFGGFGLMLRDAIFVLIPLVFFWCVCQPRFGLGSQG